MYHSVLLSESSPRPTSSYSVVLWSHSSDWTPLRSSLCLLPTSHACGASSAPGLFSLGLPCSFSSWTFYIPAASSAALRSIRVARSGSSISEASFSLPRASPPTGMTEAEPEMFLVPAALGGKMWVQGSASLPSAVSTLHTDLQVPGDEPCVGG